jgi:enolase
MAARTRPRPAHGVPLHEYLGGADATLMPMPQIQIFGGGAHAGRRVDIQDFMVVCPARAASPRRSNGRPRSTATPAR